MRKRIVMKFGGTSMGSAEAMRKASAIVRATHGEVVVVVSAMSGTTDALISIGRTAIAAGDTMPKFNEIWDRHRVAVRDLRLDLELYEFRSEIERIVDHVSTVTELSPATLDLLQGLGERMSAKVFAALLRRDGAEAESVDASRIVRTDDRHGCAGVDLPETIALACDALLPMVARRVIPVVTGFIGGTPSGKYTTLGRGGSDYSAAIVAAAIDASELQIWTDVAGMFSADPRLVKTATAIPQLSFAEAGELAYFGAKVLHPKTIVPAVEKNIPVRILDTFHPDQPGTLITNETRPSIKSVTSKKGITVVSICSQGMLDAHGFLGRIFGAFAKHEVVVDVVSTSEVSVSVTVDRAVPQALVDELRTFATVEVESGMAIVCLVGEGIRTQPDVLARLFAAVGPVPVSMVSQGASKRNVTFVVAESDSNFAVERVFRAFFS